VKAWFWRWSIHTGGDDKPKDWHRKRGHWVLPSLWRGGEEYFQYFGEVICSHGRDYVELIRDQRDSTNSQRAGSWTEDDETSLFNF